MLSMVEYIWMDGAQPTQKLRSKTRIVSIENDQPGLADFPQWSFDGSSTYQSDGSASDLVLEPVCILSDPFRGPQNFLVMCEVLNQDGSPHATNTRAHLKKVLEDGAHVHEPWIGFEQEYTLFQGAKPLGWPDGGYPAPQGPFYCGVGADEVFGRELVEEHAMHCLDAGIMLYGLNAEVMPGQWEYQLGYRGIASETADPLTVCDHAWLARWILYRTGEAFGVTATLDPKPMRGDWNGAGQHTNFSTKAMRTPGEGRKAIYAAIEKLKQKHPDHIQVYGDRLSERLTGRHETCHIDDFRSGVSDRGASVRIPIKVEQDGCGYLEDRRPGANADPYAIAHRMIKTICEA